MASGQLSATGMPILANDPHRLITLPSLRYVVHLVSAGSDTSETWNVIGGSEPAVPGVTIGHNERIAWGITIVNTDQQDLYIEELHPERPDLYRVGDEWLPLEVEQGEFRVRGESQPRRIDLKYCRHGPLIHEDPQSHRAVALRWAGSEPGAAGYLASLSVDRAQDWQGFLDAAKRWKVPSSNLVYADVDGHIGWIAAALTPVREGWDGLLPTTGASETREWAGWLPVSELPQKADPAEGFIATANQNVLPSGYPHVITYDWSPPFRQQHIETVLKSSQRFDVESFKELQHDATSVPARRLIDLLVRRSTTGDLGGEAELFAGWSHVLGKDSTAAALFETWRAKLVEMVVKPRVPPYLWPIYSLRSPDEVLLDLLERPDAQFGFDHAKGRDAVLDEALAQARREVEGRFGADPRSWQWGKLHQAHFRHMLSPITSGSTASPDGAAAVTEVFDLPSISRGGDSQTPLATAGQGFEQTSGASYMQIMDLSDWDKCVALNAPGQSGQPGSRHYSDLLPLWAEGRYFPLLFSREAIEASNHQRLILQPAEA